MNSIAKSALGAFAALLCAAWAAPEFSQAYPSRPIRLIVPYTPGAGADTLARILADRLRVPLGQTVVVENRGGAGGVIGTDAGAKSAPDGYTWIWGSDASITINPVLTRVPYDPQRDLIPVSLLARIPVVLVVNPAVPARNVQELVALAKARPGKLTFASSGNGTTAHLGGESFNATTGINVLHVPYKGQNPALIDVIAGRADMNFSAVVSVLQYAKDGKLRILAATGRQRFAGMPEVPTIAESGYPDYELDIWHGLLMPAGTPAAIVARINEELTKILSAPDMVERLNVLGIVPVGGPPEVLAKLIATDLDRWARLIKSAGIRAD